MLCRTLQESQGSRKRRHGALWRWVEDNLTNVAKPVAPIVKGIFSLRLPKGATNSSRLLCCRGPFPQKVKLLSSIYFWGNPKTYCCSFCLAFPFSHHLPVLSSPCAVGCVSFFLLMDELWAEQKHKPRSHQVVKSGNLSFSPITTKLGAVHIWRPHWGGRGVKKSPNFANEQ